MSPVPCFLSFSFALPFIYIRIHVLINTMVFCVRIFFVFLSLLFQECVYYTFWFPVVLACLFCLILMHSKDILDVVI